MVRGTFALPMLGRLGQAREMDVPSETGGPAGLTAHDMDARDALHRLDSQLSGLSRTEVERRHLLYGRNELALEKPPGLPRIVLRQFASPVIYILIVAALISLALEEWVDAGFVGVILIINATIGALQEYGAERSAAALRKLVVTRVPAIRDGRETEIDARDLVPGDIVLLESGNRVPADVRLLSSDSLEIDESLLTGESVTVAKDPDRVLSPDAPVADRVNAAFAGTVVTRGRGRAVVTAIGAGMVIGQIASGLSGQDNVRPPLLQRMERLTRFIGVGVVVASVLVGALATWRGMSASDALHTVIALAVGAIPEGLPIAITVALAVASARMARRRVIVRKLVAVESLGSCTFIASDKTGTLTLNQLTIRRVWTPAGEWDIAERQGPPPEAAEAVQALVEAGLRCSDAFFEDRDGHQEHHGDAVDVAFLRLGHELEISRAALLSEDPEVGFLPFDSQWQFAASFSERDGVSRVALKGAVERVLPMCSSQAGAKEGDSPIPLDARAVERAAQELATHGYKVLAVAGGETELRDNRRPGDEDFHDLQLLGLVGIIDPLRPGAAEAVAHCHEAGLEVAMVTGDHPITALAIARQLGLAASEDEVVTGSILRDAQQRGGDSLREAVRGARVFARVEPEQKLDIVRTLIAAGHFVAVTGDGVNDAPALRSAHVGVAMGKSGTDVAREAADLVITDDDFASIVAGVEEGRVAYSNVRKVVYLLIATGVAEIFLVLLAVAFGDPLPLLPAQILWLNLVTNGIQDVALAFEPGEGDELQRPPRSPGEPIFNPLMLARVAASAALIGALGFAIFHVLLERGWEVSDARNVLLLFLVFCENILVGNARSETRSVLRLSPLRNKLLLVGTVAAQGVHLVAMHTPGLSGLLEIHPIGLREWVLLLALAVTVFAADEVLKLVWNATHRPRGKGPSLKVASPA